VQRANWGFGSIGVIGLGRWAMSIGRIKIKGPADSQRVVDSTSLKKITRYIEIKLDSFEGPEFYIDIYQGKSTTTDRSKNHISSTGANDISRAYCLTRVQIPPS
jgi:hypothetical protein